MIRRLLIANRGEIALRIIRACRELNIESVAVHSDVDAMSPHVLAADHAVAIGAAPAADSYLSIPRVIAAARTSGADAVHPGYGFLSENPAFANACAEAGVIFVGPPAGVMEKMGSKIEARRVAIAAGAPVVPGETPNNQGNAGLRQAIERVGLPALIKASAGGGGRGMRIVRDYGDADSAIDAARREAAGAFSDGALRRTADRGARRRDQILADDHGRFTCSSATARSTPASEVIEENLPPRSPSIRTRMTEAAVAIARAASSQRRHDRVSRQRQRILLSRDEHAAAGRASRDREVAASISSARSCSWPPVNHCHGRRISSCSGDTPSKRASTLRTPRRGFCRRPVHFSSIDNPTCPACGSIRAWSKAVRCPSTTTR
jgi:acetyl/propionyl-CoA carboxylase alpha subunit